MASKSKKFREIALYRVLCNFNTEMTDALIEMRNDVKMFYGENLINKSLNLLYLIKKAYKDSEPAKKIDIIDNIISDVAIIGDVLYFLNKSKYLSQKKYTKLMAHIGNIDVQGDMWINALKNKK